MKSFYFLGKETNWLELNIIGGLTICLAIVFCII
jgi:hypothetical protein